MSDHSPAPVTPSLSRDRPSWYHSLYWRIALGLIAFLGLALAAQGLLFIWMTDRIAGSMPARSPRQLAFLVASDLSSALEREPAIDVEMHLRQQYGSVFQPIVVLMRDGRTATNRDTPQELEEELRAELARFRARPRFDARRGPRPGAPAQGNNPGPRRRADFA